MKNRNLYPLLTISIIFVFIMSLFSTVNVLADDSTPPAPTEQPVQPPTEEPAVVTEATPASTPEAVTPAQILESAPEGMEVIVLDENGEPISLVTEEAAQIILNGDPMWCPEGITPGTDDISDPQCSGSHLTFTDLVAELAGDPSSFSGNGTIYVAWNYDYTGEGDIVLDHAVDLGALDDLVIQGGWNFTDEDIDTLQDYSNLGSNSLTIANWAGNVTVNNIFINGASGVGLEINTLGDVDLNHVSVEASALTGAYIVTEGSVTITNSDFTSNLENGLIVENMGDITITNVTATGNYDNGAIFDNSCGCLMGNIFISSSNFDSNGLTSEGRGLIAHSNGVISLANVTASGNGGGGAELDNDLSGGGSGDISLTGTNTFNNNGWNLSPSVGLWAVSNGHVSLNGVTASGNGLGFGGGAFVATNGGNIFITNSIFSGNCTTCEAGFGFVTMNNGGDITLNGVTANGNGNDPINGDLGIGVIIFNNGGNTFVKYSDFNSNCTLGDCFGGGIEVLSFGNVFFDHVTANGNGTVTGGGGGANIDSGGNIDIYCSTFSNNFGYGLTVDILGGSVLTLNGVIFGGNTDGDLDPPISGGTWVENPFDCNPEHTKKKIVDGSSLPLNIVNVTGGQSVELDCEHFGGTKLLLENGNSITLPCPINDSASIIDNNKIEDLPKPIPQGNTFLSAFTTSASKKGEKLGKLGSFATISFVIPEGADASKLAILFWNSTEWTDVKNTYVRNDPVTGDSYFEAYVNDTGTFVLVQK